MRREDTSVNPTLKGALKWQEAQPEKRKTEARRRFG